MKKTLRMDNYGRSFSALLKGGMALLLMVMGLTVSAQAFSVPDLVDRDQAITMLEQRIDEYHRAVDQMASLNDLKNPQLYPALADLATTYEVKYVRQYGNTNAGADAIMRQIQLSYQLHLALVSYLKENPTTTTEDAVRYLYSTSSILDPENQVTLQLTGVFSTLRDEIVKDDIIPYLVQQ